MFDLYLYPFIGIECQCCNIKSGDAVIERLCEMCIVWWWSVYNITRYNIIISDAFPVLILSLLSGLTLCWQYLKAVPPCSGEPAWSLTPGSSHCTTARRTPWRKFWRENAGSRQSFSWSSVAWGRLEEMIMMVINVSKEAGLAVLSSAAHVKSLLFNINWTGLWTISLSRQHKL